MTRVGVDPVSVPESERLADVFATIARELDAAADLVETRAAVTRHAVEQVPGCDYAGISLIRRHGGVTTVAPTDETAERIHVIQNELGEGPCLSSINDHLIYQVDDLSKDERWPRFAGRVVDEFSVSSLLSFRLFTSEDTTGALNLYAAVPNAFDAHSRAVGTILAAHAAIAMASAREREHEHLETALENSRQIGIAIGILMRGENLSQDRAFAFLVDVSQRLDRKVRDVAGVIVEEGGVPGDLAGRS